MLSKIVLYCVIMYALLIVFMRLMGKRQLGQLEPSELVVTILISEVASTPIADPNRPLYCGIVPVFVLFLLELVMSLVMARSVRLRTLLAGKPSLLIAHGRIDQRQMRKNRFTPDELAEALRSQGALDLNQVQYAILETDGQLNVIMDPADRPVTAGQMGLAAEDTGYPMIVINDGHVLRENLHLLGLDERWLEKRLRAQGISAAGDVYLMTVDMAGGVFLSKKER